LRPQPVLHLFLLSVKQPESDATDPFSIGLTILFLLSPSIAAARWFDQGSQTRLRPGSNVQESKGKKGMAELAEEDFGEAMHAWQKMLRAFFSLCGKTCLAFLPMILAKDVANTLRQEVTLLSTLYLLLLPLAMLH
jgi:hypothetical protein